MKPHKSLDNKDYWCISLDNWTPSDSFMAKEILDIDWNTYIEIMVKYGAYIPMGLNEYWFNTKEEAEGVIKELEPFYVMRKLIKGI